MDVEGGAMNDTVLRKVTDSIGLMQKNLECSICLDLLQDPVSTKCDHQFCNFCVLALLQSSRKPSAPCPLCKVAITKRSLTKNEQLDKIVKGVRAVIAAVEEDTGLRCSPARGPVLFSQPDLKARQVSSESQTEGKGKRIKGKEKARNVRKGQPKSAVGIKVYQDENDCSADSENELLFVGHTNIRSSFPNLSFDARKGTQGGFQNDTDLEREAEELLNALNVAPLTGTGVIVTSCDKDADKLEQNGSVNNSGTLPVLLQGNDHGNIMSYQNLAGEEVSSTEIPPPKTLPPSGKENVSADTEVDPYEFISSQRTPGKMRIVRKRKSIRGKKCLPVFNKEPSRKVTETREVVMEKVCERSKVCTAPCMSSRCKHGGCMPNTSLRYRHREKDSYMSDINVPSSSSVVTVKVDPSLTVVDSDKSIEVVSLENESRLCDHYVADGHTSTDCARITSKIHTSDISETNSDDRVLKPEVLQDSQPVSSGGKMQDSQPVIVNKNHGKRVFATAYGKGSKGQCKSPPIDPQERVLAWLVSKHPGSDESDEEHGKDTKELWDNKVSQEGVMEDLHDNRELLPSGYKVLQSANRQDSLRASVDLPLAETSSPCTTLDDAGEHAQSFDKKAEISTALDAVTGPSQNSIRESPLLTNDNKAAQNKESQCKSGREMGNSRPKPVQKVKLLTEFGHADVGGLMGQEKVKLDYSREGHGCVHRKLTENAEGTFPDQEREMLHNLKHSTSAGNGVQGMQHMPGHTTSKQIMTENCSTNVSKEGADVAEKVAVPVIESDWEVALELAREFGTEPKQLRKQLPRSHGKEIRSHGLGKPAKKRKCFTAPERKSSRRNTKKITANNVQRCINSFQTQITEDRTKQNQEKREQTAPENSKPFLTNQQDTVKSHHEHKDKQLNDVQQVDISERDLTSTDSDLKVEDVSSMNQIVREQFQTSNSAVTSFEEQVKEITLLPSIPHYTEDITAANVEPKRTEQVCRGSDTTESIELSSNECDEMGETESHDLPLQPSKQDNGEESKIIVTTECQYPLTCEVTLPLDTEMEILNSILPSHNSQSVQNGHSTGISMSNSVVEKICDVHMCKVQLSPSSVDPDSECEKTPNLDAGYSYRTDITCDLTKPSSSLETRRQGSFPLSSLDMYSQPSESLLNSTRRSKSDPEKLIQESDASADDHEPVQNASDVNDQKSEVCSNLEKKCMKEDLSYLEDSKENTKRGCSNQKTHTSSRDCYEFECSPETCKNQIMAALEKTSSTEIAVCETYETQQKQERDLESDVPKDSVEKVSSSLSSVICISDSEDQPVRRSLRSRSKGSQDINSFRCTGRKKQKCRGKAKSSKENKSMHSLARLGKSKRRDEDNTNTNTHVTEINSVSTDHQETCGSQFNMTRKRRNSLKQNILSPTEVRRLNTEKTDLAKLTFEDLEARNRRETNLLQQMFSENHMSECASLRSQKSICTDDDPVDALIPPTPPCQDFSKSRSNLATSLGKPNIGYLGETSIDRGDTGITQSKPEKLSSTSNISSASSNQQGRSFQSENPNLGMQADDEKSSKMHLNKSVTTSGNYSQDMGSPPVITACPSAVGVHVSTASPVSPDHSSKGNSHGSTSMHIIWDVCAPNNILSVGDDIVIGKKMSSSPDITLQSRGHSPGTIAIKSLCDSGEVVKGRKGQGKPLILNDTSSDEDVNDTDVIQRRKQKRAKRIPALEEEEEHEGIDSDDDLVTCSFLQQSASAPVLLEEARGTMIDINTTVPAGNYNDCNSVSSEDSCGSQYLNQTSASSILSSQSEIMNTQQKEKTYEKMHQLEKQMVELQAALATESHDNACRAEEEDGGNSESGRNADHFGNHKVHNHSTDMAVMNRQVGDQSQMKANYTKRPCVIEVEEVELQEPQSPSPPPPISPHSMRKLSSGIVLSESMHAVTTLLEQYRKTNTEKCRITKRTWQKDVSDNEDMSDQDLGDSHVSSSLNSSHNSQSSRSADRLLRSSFSRKGKRKKCKILGDNTNDRFDQENCDSKKMQIPEKMTSKVKKPPCETGEANEVGNKGRGRHMYPDKEDDMILTSVIQTKQTSKNGRTSLAPQSSSTTPGSIQPLLGEGRVSRQRATSSEGILSEVGRETRQMSLIASGLNRIELRQVEKLTRLIDGCRFASAFNANTTHVIVKTDASLVCERTLKYFQGIAARVWVISFKWVSDSLEAELPLPEESYEVRGDVVNGLDHQGPRRSRTWDGPGFLSRYDLCCIGPYSGLNKDQLVGLCEMCGACTVQHPSLFPYTSGKRAFIVVEPNLTDTPTDYQGLYRRFRVPVISREWILDSIAQYETQPILDYLLSDAEQPITDLKK